MAKTLSALALLLALASPELEILAICTTFGNTDVDASYTNVLKVFAAIEREIAARPEAAQRFPNFSKEHKPLLVRGALGPIQGKLVTASYFHGRDGLSDISNRHPHLVPIKANAENQFEYLIAKDGHGPQVILDLLESRPPNTVTYCAMGPLTTLALTRRLSVKRAKSFDDLIGRVLVMGGALDVPGNTVPTAEFNFVADPFAAEEVLAATALTADRLFLFPLDITEDHQLPFADYIAQVNPGFGKELAEGLDPVAAFTSAFLSRTQEIMAGFGLDWVQLHDPLVVWAAAFNPPGSPLADGWKATRRQFQIETLGKYTRGMCVVDRRGGLEAGADRAEQGAITQVQLTGQEGVQVVVQTPGSRKLAQLLLQRIWGKPIATS